MKINWNKVLLRYCLFFTIYILVCLNAYAGDSTIFIGNTEYYISNTYKINKQTNIQIDTSNIGIINKTESINFNKKVAKNTNNRVSVPNQNKTIIENGCLDTSICFIPGNYVDDYIFGHVSDYNYYVNGILQIIPFASTSYCNPTLTDIEFSISSIGDFIYGFPYVLDSIKVGAVMSNYNHTINNMQDLVDFLNQTLVNGNWTLAQDSVNIISTNPNPLYQFTRLYISNSYSSYSYASGSTIIYNGIKLKVPICSKSIVIENKNTLYKDTVIYFCELCGDSIALDTCYGENLIINGDFEDSLYYWQTDLFPLTPSCGGCNGWYNIYHQTWCKTSNHTYNGSLLFSSSPTDDTSKRVLYQTIPVKPNTNYKFSAWGMSYNYNPAIFNVIINNELVINNYILNQNGCSGWENFTNIWNSGNDSIANILIKDMAQTIYGNDFGIDDISLREIIPCVDSAQQCVYIDTFNCKTLTFVTDSSRFCVPIILPSDSVTFKDNGFHFCMSYDTNFVKPTGVYIPPYNTNDFNVVIDSIVKGKVCVSITNVQRITFTNKHEINLGCMQFVLNNEPFNSTKTFDYLSFQIIDGCSNNIQNIKAWLTEDFEHWKTEDGKYWKLEE